MRQVQTVALVVTAAVVIFSFFIMMNSTEVIGQTSPVFVKVLENVKTKIIETFPPFSKVSENEKTKQSKMEIRVLNWNSRSNRPPEPPKYSPDERCMFSDDQSDYNISDVLIVSPSMFKFPLPAHRPSGQRWLFNAFQAALTSMEKFHPKNLEAGNHFNYTMTYSRTSDFPNPYGECVKMGTSTLRMSKQIDVIIKGKARVVAWMASRCQVSSLREDYLRELSQHLDIDIYGECGKLCPKGRGCDNLLSTYKFYLAFENSLCGEYITEKVWRTLKLGIVPVVYGALDTYKAVLPPHSYIDVTHYDSPKSLAEYILKVNSNDTLYRTYFNWKHTFKCGWAGKPEHLGRLCDFLLEYRQQVVDLKTVWDSPSTRCVDASQYLNKLGVSVISGKPFTKHSGTLKR